MFKKSLSVLAFAVAVSIASTAAAQITAYAFDIDDTRSSFLVSGIVAGFELGGDREAVADGTADARLGNPTEPFRGFKIDDSFVMQMDPMNITIKNPIPFLPPLGNIRVEDLSIQLTSGIVMLNPDGTFYSDSGVAQFLSGMASGDIIGIQIGPIDLTGQVILGVPLEGVLFQDGDTIHFHLPVNLELFGPMYNITITGGFYATSPVN